MANRTGKGGFKPGESGNPGGRPKLADDLRLALEAHTAAAVATLAAIMNDPNEQASARVRAAEILLKKVVPDLSSLDMTADIENRVAYTLSDTVPTEAEWEAEHCTEH